MMKSDLYIHLETFCNSHGVETTLLKTFHDYDLIRIETIESRSCIRQEELPIIERMLRLHHDLEINPPGIQAVSHLLDKIEGLQQEVDFLRRRLNRLEPEE